jgi:hypothetical protein
MDEWGWVVVYAVGLALLQVLVYRYLWRRGGSPAGESVRRWYDEPRQRADARSQSRSRPRSGRPPVEAVAPDEAVDPRSGPPTEADGRRCPHCGAENEPDATFDRCWNCATRLG